MARGVCCQFQLKSASGGDFAHRCDNALFAWEKFFFQRRAGGNRCERRGNADDGTVQIVESFLLQPRYNFGTYAALFDRFVDDDQPAGFLDRRSDRVDIQR